MKAQVSSDVYGVAAGIVFGSGVPKALARQSARWGRAALRVNREGELIMQAHAGDGNVRATVRAIEAVADGGEIAWVPAGLEKAANGRVTIDGERACGVATIETELVGELPLPWPRDNEVASIVFNPQAVARLRWVALAMSEDETRFTLNGVALYRREGEGNVYIAATDGRRLHVAELPDWGAITGFNFLPEGSPSALILPPLAVWALTHGAKKAVAGEEPILRIYRLRGARVGEDGAEKPTPYWGWRVDGMLGKGKGAQASLWGACIDGQYPSVEQVIPSDSLRTYTVWRECLDEAVRRRIAAIKLDGSLGKALTIELGTEARAILGEGEDDKQTVGCAHGEVCDTYPIALDPAFLRELVALEAHAKGYEFTALLDVTDTTSPVKARYTGHGEGCIGVLMPMRVK